MAYGPFGPPMANQKLNEKDQTMVIQVTKQDISQGKRTAPDECPIALAIKRQLKHTYVSVGRDFISLMKIGRLDRLATPKRVSRFILSFDCNFFKWLWCRPFSFDLDVPARYLPRLATEVIQINQLATDKKYQNV
jgi:hypothetical protein